MPRLGLAFLGGPEVPRMVAAARLAEEHGYESVWVAETRFARDGFVPAAAIAAATRRVKVGTGIVNVFTRGPVLNAISFATLDELAGGRAIMGLGPGSPLVLAPQGEEFHKPVTRLRESVEVARRLIRGERVEYTGEVVRVPGVQLEFTPVRPAIPVYLGVTGPKALALAGAMADGVLLNGFTSPEYARRALEKIAAGARGAGRDPQQVDVCNGMVTAMDRDGTAARDRVRPFVAMYLARFPNIAQETGFPAETVLRVRATVDAEGLEAGSRLVTDAMVNHLVAAGTPDEVRARIKDYREAGIRCPVLFIVGDNIEEVVTTLADA